MAIVRSNTKTVSMLELIEGKWNALSALPQGILQNVCFSCLILLSLCICKVAKLRVAASDIFIKSCLRGGGYVFSEVMLVREKNCWLLWLHPYLLTVFSTT